MKLFKKALFIFYLAISSFLIVNNSDVNSAVYEETMTGTDTVTGTVSAYAYNTRRNGWIAVSVNGITGATKVKLERMFLGSNDEDWCEFGIYNSP